MLQSILILNLMIVILRMIKLRSKEVKPTFKEELTDYINHLVGAHVLFIIISFLFYIF